jgi:A/G-specific adenine glycosylase
VKKQDFQELVWEKGRKSYRDMAWRRDTQPYYVLVSELMLQQTQVSRVEPKFAEFITRFPTVESLAEAQLADVLVLWSGLGYNRRAKFLWRAAQMIQHKFDGTFPDLIDELMKLPGVGKNTAGAIAAYAFNQPSLFVETNIRTVYLHHFFASRNDVTDTEILDKLAETLDHEHPREWYWSLMDYGSWLKSQRLGQISGSKHYAKQSKLAGSLREMRGRILKALATGALDEDALKVTVDADKRYSKAKQDLLAEGLITQTSTTISLG